MSSHVFVLSVSILASFYDFFYCVLEIVGIVLFIIMLFILFCLIWFDFSNLERNRDSFNFVLVNLSILRLLLVISLSQRTGQILVSKARCQADIHDANVVLFQIRLIMKSLKIP